MIPGVIASSLAGHLGSAPVFTADSPPGATNGTFYSYYFAATGSGTITYGIASGTIPTGMGFTSGGLLYGTPTVSSTFTFTVSATNSFGTTTTPLLAVTVSSAAASAQILIVGFGGNGYTNGGGGGGGQVVQTTASISAGNSFPITVSSPTASFNGTSATAGSNGTLHNGGASGSGNAGGTGTSTTGGGGGGGAGSAGTNGGTIHSQGTGGSGGDGIQWSIDSTYYGGGGAGMGGYANGTAGQGQSTYGGGGDGFGTTTGNGGVVKVAMPSSYTGTPTGMPYGTSTVSGYTIYTFTSSGTVTF